MTGAAIVLVLISAFAHATWNLLAKRATRPEVFTWWMTAAGSTIFLPVAIYYFVTDPPSAAGWGYIAATVALHTGYFFSLGRAYKHSDLSLVYPVARGLGIALIPILGVTIIGETVTWPAAVGAAFIVGGVLSVGLSGGPPGSSMRLVKRAFSDIGARYAVATGLIIAAYSIVDKQGVQHVPPLLYMFCLSTGGGLGMLALIWRSYTPGDFAAEFRAHRKEVVLGGLFQFAAYGLVLSALRLSPVSYVATIQGNRHIGRSSARHLRPERTAQPNENHRRRLDRHRRSRHSPGALTPPRNGRPTP